MFAEYSHVPALLFLFVIKFSMLVNYIKKTASYMRFSWILMSVVMCHQEVASVCDCRAGDSKEKEVKK